MRILLLTKKNRNPYNIRLHYNLLMELKGLAQVIPIEIVKGPKEKPYVSAKDLYIKYEPDVMMMHFHAPMLEGYLKGIPCKKIMVCVDYYKAIIRSFFGWYESNEFDLIIQRGWYDPSVYNKIPMVWLPFSADPKQFYRGNERRKKKVGFSGNWQSPVYTWRRRALQKLEGAGLLLKPEKLLLGKAYCEFLRGVKVGFTSAECKGPYARMFELMASGTVVLTHPFLGGRELFGEECYITCKEDSSDIVKKARNILVGNSQAKELAQKAYEIFLQKHTDAHRLYELYGHIKNLLEGKEIERKWGI